MLTLSIVLALNCLIIQTYCLLRYPLFLVGIRATVERYIDQITFGCIFDSAHAHIMSTCQLMVLFPISYLMKKTVAKCAEINVISITIRPLCCAIQCSSILKHISCECYVCTKKTTGNTSAWVWFLLGPYKLCLGPVTAKQIQFSRQHLYNSNISSFLTDFPLITFLLT